MANLELSFSIGRNPRSNPILTGEVKPEGIDLHASSIHPSELFWRQLGFQEFEASEMSMSSLLMAISHGIDTWVAVPIFTSRTFFHTGVLVAEGSGITEPGQLNGKRVGVPEYQQTAALWARGILQHEYDVDPRKIHWYMERPPERSHGGATGFVPPEGVDLQYMSRDTDMGEMLANGEIDAALLYIAGANNLVDRSSRPLGDPGSGALRLFDRRAEATRYFKKTGLFPVNHCVAVRRDVVESNPWVPVALYEAFVEAKQLAQRRTNASIENFAELGLIDEAAEADLLGTDLFPYGIKANGHLLDTITQYSYEQGLSSRLLTIEDIFHPSTLEL
jgi:4,5-dihydroxyphthalate decarboxylase